MLRGGRVAKRRLSNFRQWIGLRSRGPSRGDSFAIARRSRRGAVSIGRYWRHASMVRSTTGS